MTNPDLLTVTLSNMNFSRYNGYSKSNPGYDDNISYVSDSCSELSQSDYDLDFESHDELNSDIDLGCPNNTAVDFSVPDIKAMPPKLSDQIDTITLPPAKCKITFYIW